MKTKLQGLILGIVPVLMVRLCLLVFLSFSCFGVLLIVSPSVFAQAFESGREPDGFGGLKWGTDVTTIEGMEHIYDGELGGSVPVDVSFLLIQHMPRLGIYQRTRDRLQIGSVPLSAITYGFCDGKLCEVTLVSRGEENWKPFMEEVFRRFGKGSLVRIPLPPCKGVGAVEFYAWMGDMSEMELEGMLSHSNYVENRLWIGSKVLRDQIFNEESQKNKDGEKHESLEDYMK